MTTDRLTLQQMALLLAGQQWRSCQLCGQFRRCHRVFPSFTAGQRAVVFACPPCLNRVAKAVYEPAVASLLELTVEDALRAVGRQAVLCERERQKALAQGWEGATALLVRALDGKQGAAANRVALSKAIKAFTGLDLIRSKELVERAMLSAARPLELPAERPTPSAGAHPT